VRSTWARLIHKVYEMDPLECPRCKGPMRVTALIDDAAVIRKRGPSRIDFPICSSTTAGFQPLLDGDDGDRPLVMGIALHPYIVGQPYRLRHLRRALQHIGTAKNVWFTTPGKIYDVVAK